MSNLSSKWNLDEQVVGRRAFLACTSSAAGSFLLLTTVATAAEERGKQGSADTKETSEEEVAPAEDLMREHGLLNRVLLIYDEAITRLTSGRGDVPPDVLTGAADIVRTFVEDYHEKLEENFLFPRFRKAGKQLMLVETLLQQHQAGRVLTDQVKQLAAQLGTKKQDISKDLIAALTSFNRMYRPHEAREDTVLFPAFKKIVSSHEYSALGEDFEKKENELFGEDGFESMVDRVAALEQKFGIYDLSKFTPR